MASIPANFRNFLALVSPTRWKCLLVMNFSIVFSSLSLIIRLSASTSTPYGWGSVSFGAGGIDSVALS